MAWQLFENWKDGKIGEVETTVSLDKASVQNAAASLFIAGLLLILTWYLVTKKL